MTDSLKTLRGELPALALTIGFAPAGKREALAALMLFWLELRRAGLSDEVMVRATRMAWWRDALRDGTPDSVPLAESLINLKINKELSGDIDKLIEQILSDSGGGAVPFFIISRHLAKISGIDESAINSTLINLDKGISGESSPKSPRTGHAVFDLLNWCCEMPTRLEYPHRHPLLALRMMLRAAYFR